MPQKQIDQRQSLVLAGRSQGITVIPRETPLTRLNYFDGKFLRADDLQAEQRYLRRLVELSNQADGGGVAHGYDVSLASGDGLQIGPGLAIDPRGRTLLLPQETVINIQELIEKSEEIFRLRGQRTVFRGGTFEECDIASETPDNVVGPGDLYVITIAHAEAFCGEEDVYGKLCEEACLTSTDRPYRVEGLVVRALPLILTTPLAASKAIAISRKHFRSRVASAYFADERARIVSLISKAGLASDTWCFGAEGASGFDVPIAVISRAGLATHFLDPWIARREKMDTPAKRYWQWRMAMRPWDVYLAQILQFQCQLPGALRRTADPGAEDDPCMAAGEIIGEASLAMAELAKFYETIGDRLAELQPEIGVPGTFGFTGGADRITELENRLREAGEAIFSVPRERLLIGGGIVELPSAGYLPVVPGSAIPVDIQVRRLMGEGVDLRFCAVRPDYVPHALEEAQHMERISLLQGLDDPENKPEVDILVPNGVIESATSEPAGRGFAATVTMGSRTSMTEDNIVNLAFGQTTLTGAGRDETSRNGSGGIFLAAMGESESASDDTGTIGVKAAYWLNFQWDPNIMALQAGQSGKISGRFILARVHPPHEGTIREGAFDMRVVDDLRVMQRTELGSTTKIEGELDVTMSTANTFSDPPKTFDLPVTLAITLERTDQPNGRQLKISLQAAPDTNFAIASPIVIETTESPASISITSPGPGAGAVAGVTRLDENADVFATSHPLHVRAVESIDLIAKYVVDATKFRQEALARLFPPPKPSQEDSVVRATLPWVLFHRRRANECEGMTRTIRIEEPTTPAEPPPEPEVKTVCQAVVALGRARDIEVALELIERERIADLFSPTTNDLPLAALLGRVVFRAGAPSDATPEVLNDSLTPVAGAWPASQVPGHILVVTGPGQEVSFESEATRQAKVVYAALPGAPEISSDAVTPVESPVAIPGDCPSMIIVVPTAATPVPTPPVETTCHAVFLAGSLSDQKTLATMVAAGQVTAANFADILRRLTKPLGNVTFTKDTAEVPDNSLEVVIEQWASGASGVPGGSLLLTPPGSAAALQAVARDQGQAIVKSLPGVTDAAIAAQNHVASPVALPTDCTAITVIAPVDVRTETRTGRIVVAERIRRTRRVERLARPLFVGFQPDRSLAGLPGNTGDLLGPSGPLVSVDFAPREGRANPGAQERAKSVTTALIAKGFLPRNTQFRVVDATAAEIALFDDAGISAQDLIFLIKG